MPTEEYFKLGILGWPLGYSLSPGMHERALAAAGLKGEYREYPVKPEDLWGWLEQVPTLGLSGFNVTMPYKKSVFAWIVGQGNGKLGRPEAWLRLPEAAPLVISESPDAAIGAVNTVVMDRGKPVGYNTDGEGFLRPLIEPPRSLDLTGWHVLLLGAGGAAEAVAISLALQTKVGRLTIWNRHPDRAKVLAETVNQLRRNDRFAQSVDRVDSLPVQECQLVVNATPVGMNGPGEKLVDSKQLKEGQWVYDLVYEPRETRLIRAARERGCRVITGDEMLAGQGVASFELWTGVKGMLPVMQEALDEHFRRPR
ncbi:MAG: shikimate dehydrogenase [Candidatus Omnitrophica bacterium]|nr:shikimate dehydrogenase [Candidatus Omnitrophota bacterium]